MFAEPQFRKSTYSNPTGNCVEVANGAHGTKVRDSKDGGVGPTLAFTADEWSAFIAGVKAGEFG